MSRGSSGRLHDWICWSLIAGSLTLGVAATYHALASLEELAAEVHLQIPERAKPPPWLIAISSGVVAVFLAACLSRRVRAWLRMRPSLSRPSRSGDAYLEAFTLKTVLTGGVIGAFVLIGWHWPALRYWRYFASLLAVAYAFTRCRSIRIPLADWGWRRGRGVWREISIGVFLGFFFAHFRYLPGAALDAIDTTCRIPKTSLTLLTTVAWAPIVEETFFRGMLYRYLRDRWRWPLAVLISAAVFATVHAPLPVTDAFLGGILTALLREWRGSLLAPIAAHATNNLLFTLVW